MTDTKTKILEAAEQVILREGPEGATIRRITDEAGVNVAAVNYHFGSKEELGKALLVKFVGPIGDERLRMLTEARKTAGGGPLHLETIIRCMFEPMITLKKEGGRTHALMMGISRLFGNENLMKLSFREIVGPMVMSFRRELLLAMPNAEETSVDFFLVLMMTMTPTLMNNTIGTIMSSMIGREVPYEDVIGDLICVMVGGARVLATEKEGRGIRKDRSVSMNDQGVNPGGRKNE